MFQELNNAYQGLSSFEKVCLLMGVAFYILIPLLEEHPGMFWIGEKIIMPMLSTIGELTFITGILAFLERLHFNAKTKL